MGRDTRGFEIVLHGRNDLERLFNEIADRRRRGDLWASLALDEFEYLAERGKLALVAALARDKPDIFAAEPR